MPYAAVTDMVTRFGPAEMIRLSVPDGQPMDQINPPPIMLALGDASDLIDTYVSKRYQTPITNIPATINRACCILARYDLSTGGGREPSEMVRLARKETIAWLEGVATGKVLLPLDEVPAGDNSFAQMSDRGAVYGPGQRGNAYPSIGTTYPQSDQGGQAGCDDGTPLPPYWSEELT